MNFVYILLFKTQVVYILENNLLLAKSLIRSWLNLIFKYKQFPLSKFPVLIVKQNTIIYIENNI